MTSSARTLTMAVVALSFSACSTVPPTSSAELPTAQLTRYCEPGSAIARTTSAKRLFPPQRPAPAHGSCKT